MPRSLDSITRWSRILVAALFLTACKAGTVSLDFRANVPPPLPHSASTDMEVSGAVADQIAETNGYCGPTTGGSSLAHNPYLVSVTFRHADTPAKLELLIPNFHGPGHYSIGSAGEALGQLTVGESGLADQGSLMTTLGASRPSSRTSTPRPNSSPATPSLKSVWRATGGAVVVDGGGLSGSVTAVLASVVGDRPLSGITDNHLTGTFQCVDFVEIAG